MRTIAIIATLLMGMLASTQYIFGQEEKEKNVYNYSIGVQPLYLFNTGLRIDFEKRLKDPRQMLQVSAIGYLLPKRDEPYEYWETLLVEDHYNVNKLLGGGLALDYKYFPFRLANFLYFSGGLSYHYFDVRYDGFKFISYQEDGMTFYEPQWGEIKQVFNKVGGNVLFGLQTAPHRRVFVDGYIGIGYTHSFYDEDKHHIDDNMFNVGYRGVTFVTGIKIGYRFGKR